MNKVFYKRKRIWKRATKKDLIYSLLTNYYFFDERVKAEEKIIVTDSKTEIAENIRYNFFEFIFIYYLLRNIYYIIYLKFLAFVIGLNNGESILMNVLKSILFIYSFCFFSKTSYITSLKFIKFISNKKLSYSLYKS